MAVGEGGWRGRRERPMISAEGSAPIQVSWGSLPLKESNDTDKPGVKVIEKFSIVVLK